MYFTGMLYTDQTSTLMLPPKMADDDSAEKVVTSRMDMVSTQASISS